MSYADAVKITGEPVGTVKWRVHAVTKRLRNLLSGAFAEEYPIEIRKGGRLPCRTQTNRYYLTPTLKR